jgi:flagellar assembly factor FliW
MSTLQTARFGDLEYEEADMILLPEGLIGLPELKRWILCDMDEDVPMKWLQSIDREEFCVPVTSPGFFHDGYEVIIPRPIHDMLGGGAVEDHVVLIIATVASGGERITGNLAAPPGRPAGPGGPGALHARGDRLSQIWPCRGAEGGRKYARRRR